METLWPAPLKTSNYGMLVPFNVFAQPSHQDRPVAVCLIETRISWSFLRREVSPSTPTSYPTTTRDSSPRTSIVRVAISSLINSSFLPTTTPHNHALLLITLSSPMRGGTPSPS